MRSTIASRLLVAAAMLAVSTLATSAEGRTTLRNICRVKGQEETTLNGLGIVVGLKGTGDGASSLPTIRSLATMMQLMGKPLGPGGVEELKDAKNVALVVVTATIPATGACRGDKLDCAISAISAKSLAGGRLFVTPLTGPIPSENPPVFALAQGPITLDNEEMTTTGRIHEGCRLVEDFFSPFSEGGKIMLVVQKDYAGFRVAQEIADRINTEMTLQSGGVTIAKALDQVNIEVTVPPVYADALVDFISQILGLEMLVDPPTGPRVVVFERSGSIVIDGDVEIGPVLITHRNVVVETGGAAGSQFMALDSQDAENPKLKTLLAALDAVQVAPEDVIDIIKALHRDGKLYAQLIIE